MGRPKQARGGNDEITRHRFHSSSNTGGAIYRKLEIMEILPKRIL